MEKQMEQQLISKIGSLKSKNMSLKATIDDMEQAAKSNRKKVQQAINIDNTDPTTLQKQLLSLQLQSHKLTKRLNQTVAQNGILKDKVNAARNERIIQSGIFKGFEKEIHTLQQTYKYLLVQRIILQLKKEKITKEGEDQAESKQKPPQKISIIEQPKQPKELKQEQRSQMESTIRINPTMKRIMERKKQVQKQQDACLQTYTNNMRIIGKFAETYGLKNVEKIEDETAAIEYEIDQIAIQNYELSQEIVNLDIQFENLEKMKKSLEQQRYIEDKNDTLIQPQTQEQARIREQIEKEKQQIDRINEYMKEVAKKINISQDSHDLHQKIQQYFARQPKYNVLTDRTEIERQHGNKQENRINHLINKSKLMHESNSIMTRSQFKQAFKEIQTKPTVKLHR